MLKVEVRNIFNLPKRLIILSKSENFILFFVHSHEMSDNCYTDILRPILRKLVEQIRANRIQFAMVVRIMPIRSFTL